MIKPSNMRHNKPKNKKNKLNTGIYKIPHDLNAGIYKIPHDEIYIGERQF